MRISPDEMIFWQHGFLKLNGTIVSGKGGAIYAARRRLLRWGDET
jgi:hypothetical protein